MNSTAKTTARLRGLIPALLLLLVTAGPGVAADKEISLRAVSTTRTILGDTVTFWVFDETSTALLARRVPGPKIGVDSGQKGLKITLTNNLSVPTSIIVPGQSPPEVQDAGGTPLGTQGVTRTADGRVRSLTQETPAGATRIYYWKSFRPGTYMYQSGTNMSMQVQMGLYGGACKKGEGKAADEKGKAYKGGGYDFDAEVMLFYSEVDPGLHAAVAGGTYGTADFPNTLDYLPRYFLINGEQYNPLPGVVPPGLPPGLRPPPGELQPPFETVAAGGGKPVLIRLINAGLRTRVPTLLGSHFDVIAEDGNTYPHSKEQHSVVLQPGKTKDLLLDIPDDAVTYPIYDARLYRSAKKLVSGGWSTTAGAGRNGGNTAYLKFE